MVIRAKDLDRILRNNKNNKRNNNIILLDVREDWERKICKIKGDIHIPLKSLPSKVGELPKRRKIIVYCHSGNRSGIAAKFLNENGFDAENLQGGIDKWALSVDKKMKRY